jgi:hypothetical protein
VTQPRDADAAAALAEIRHVVEESLARYTRAMDDQDAEAAATLLADAELHFKTSTPMRGRSDIAAFYTSVFPNAARTRHLVTNLTLERLSGCIEYAAIYQRWSVADPAAPVCETLGMYAGRFTLTPKGLIWSEHRVIAS